MSNGNRWLRWIQRILLVTGILLLGVLVAKVDAREVADRMLQSGWWFAAALGAYVLTMLVSTAAWREIAVPHGSTASYYQFLAAFWAGHAINAATPGGGMGEVVKGSILGKSIRGETLVASLILHAYLTATTNLAFTVLGPLLCLLLLDLPDAVVVGVFGAAVVMVAIVLLLRLFLVRGLTGRLVRLADRIPFITIRDAEKLAERASAVDHQIRDFRRHRPGAFHRALSWLVVARVFQLTEIWFLLISLLPEQDPAWTLVLSLLVRSATQLISKAMMFVPGQVGVLEGGNALLFQLLGLDPLVGLSMELLRRVRQIMGITVGLIIGTIVDVKSKRARETAAAERSGP